MTATDEETSTDGQTGYAAASIKRVAAADGIEYAFRDVGAGDVPLVLLQHFRGNLDNWDPALVDDLAEARRVVTFDNRGVGGSTGATPSTIEAMARDAISFVDAMGFENVDLLGFSIGSFVAQEMALIRPDLLRRVVLASSAPRGASGMHGWAPEVIGAVGTPQTSPQGYLDVFFAHTDSSREAGQQAAGRIFGPRAERDEPTTWQTRQAQYDAVCAWGIPNHSLLQRLVAIELPVFVANGDSDPMILPRYSYLLAGLLPDARVDDLPGLGARLPVPAPRAVRGRCARVPGGGRLMPMIDVYAAAGTFPDRHALARDLAAAVMRWEQVPDLPLFASNTAAFIHDLDAEAISNVAGESNYVRVQVLTPVGVLDRDKQLGVVSELTEIVAAAAGDPGLRERTWVLLTESPEGGWGIAGHANTNADIAASARAALAGR